MKRISICISMVLLLLSTFAPSAKANLIAYYGFEGDAQNGAPTGSLYDGIVNGAPTLVSGYSGQAYSFQGSPDRIVVPLNINPGMMPKITIGAWAKVAVNNGNIEFVMSHSDGGADRTIAADFRSGAGTWSVLGGPVLGYIPGSPIIMDQWTFLAAVYDQDAKTVLLDVNGTIYQKDNAELGTGWENLYIGSTKNNAFFKGAIDEVFVYDEALSLEQLKGIQMMGTQTMGMQMLEMQTNAIDPVPVPGALLLIGSGLVGLSGYLKKTCRRNEK